MASRLLVHGITCLMVLHLVLAQRLFLVAGSGGSGVLPLVAFVTPVIAGLLVLQSRGRCLRVFTLPVMPVFIAYAVLSVILPIAGIIVTGSHVRTAFAATHGILVLSFIVLGAWLVDACPDARRRWRILGGYLLLGILAQAAYASVQHLSYTTAVASPFLAVISEWDAATYAAYGQQLLSRSTGFYANPNILGVWAVMVTVVAFIAFRASTRFIAILLGVLTLGLSQSRGAMAAMVVSVTWLLVEASLGRARGVDYRVRASRIVAVMIVVVGVLAFQAHADDTFSARIGSGLAVVTSPWDADPNLAGRIAYWESAFAAFRAYPLGTMSPPEHLTGIVMDSDWVRVMLQGSFLYLIAFTAVIGGAVFLTDQSRVEGKIVSVTAIALAVLAFTQPVFLYPPAMLFWLLLGAYFAVTHPESGVAT